MGATRHRVIGGPVVIVDMPNGECVSHVTLTVYANGRTPEEVRLSLIQYFEERGIKATAEFIPDGYELMHN